jgi:hypothetical protein
MRGLVVACSVGLVGMLGLATITVKTGQQLKRVEVELDATKEQIKRTQLAAFVSLTKDEGIERKRLMTDVGTIQFLGRSPPFTVELERADYRADGLELSGYLGNPSSLDIFGVTLQVQLFRESGLREFTSCFPKDGGAAQPTVEQAGESAGFDSQLFVVEFECGSSSMMFPERGTLGQSRPIVEIRRGSRQPFTLLVPNVRPKLEDGTYLHATLSGARYSY